MLYGYEFDSPCFQSVRTRRAVLAREIDAVAARRPGAHVLAVASGHLREIEWSRAARSGAVTITAIDQDCGGAAIAILAPWVDRQDRRHRHVRCGEAHGDAP